MRLFWEQRISKDEHLQLIILKLTSALVKQKSLSIKKSALFSDHNLKYWNILLSMEIIKEIAMFQQKVSFYHNILFDYFVAIYIFDDEGNKFTDFLKNTPQATIFLRPSFPYYFTSLWYYDQKAFWENLKLMLSENEPCINIIAKTIPISVILCEFKPLEDIDHLFSYNDEIKSKTIKYLLYGIRVIDTISIGLLGDLYYKLQDDIKSDFAWNLAVSNHKLSIRTSNDDILSKCNAVALKLHKWAINNKKRRGYNLCDSWCTPVIVKTFQCNEKDSKKYIYSILFFQQLEKIMIILNHYIIL